MSELLFAEKAKHYLLSGKHSGETIIVTVSTSEVIILIRFSAPGKPIEANIIAQAVTVDSQNYEIMLKQVQHFEDHENDERDSAVKFLKELGVYLDLVQERRQADNDPLSAPVQFLRNGILELLEQMS